MNVTIYTFLPIILIFLAGNLLLLWQERKHKFETSLFYTFEQLQQKIHIPKRDFLDSWLIVAIGATLLEFGGITLWTIVRMMGKMDRFANAQTKKVIEESMPPQIIFASILLGGGIALLILGIRSVLMNWRYKKQKKS